MKLLLVEDSRRITSHIRALFNKNHIIDIAHTATEGVNKATNRHYDVIMLDLGLPDFSGLEVCQNIRKRGIETPILILTGMDTTGMCARALNYGADDYITKPFKKDEFIARVTALGRRHNLQYKSQELTAGDLLIKVESREVLRAGIKIKLRPKEFNILEYLVTNKGRALTRQMILNHAWQDDRDNWHNTVDVQLNTYETK